MNALITNNALQLIALPDSRPQARIIFNKVELYNARDHSNGSKCYHGHL